MRRSRFPARFPARLALAACLPLALWGCVSYEQALDRAFPPAIAGVPDAEAWLNLPIRSWVNDGAVTAEAMGGCFETACAPRLGIGIFHAAGEEAATVASLLQDPARLAPDLAAHKPERARARSKAKRYRSVAKVEAFDPPGFRGFAVTLSRPDGSRAASVIALARADALAQPHPEAAPLRFLLLVGPGTTAPRRAAEAAARANLE